jgi:hypothetical protein
MLRLLTGGLRRSLSTAASRPPWALIQLTSMDKSGAPAPGASCHLDAPPFLTNLTVPAHFVHPRPLLDPATGKHGSVPGQVCATSGHGFLLVRFWESRFGPSAPAATTATPSYPPYSTSPSPTWTPTRRPRASSATR